MIATCKKLVTDIQRDKDLDKKLPEYAELLRDVRWISHLLCLVTPVCLSVYLSREILHATIIIPFSSFRCRLAVRASHTDTPPHNQVEYKEIHQIRNDGTTVQRTCGWPHKFICHQSHIYNCDPESTDWNEKHKQHTCIRIHQCKR